MGLRRFQCWGKEGAKAEMGLGVLAYNLNRMIKDYGLETDHLNAELSGASNVSLTINEEIDIEASGASILKYKGNAVITNQDLSGASSVKKM